MKAMVKVKTKLRSRRRFFIDISQRAGLPDTPAHVHPDTPKKTACTPENLLCLSCLFGGFHNFTAETKNNLCHSGSSKFGRERVIGENTDELTQSVENRNDRTKPESNIQ